MEFDKPTDLQFVEDDFEDGAHEKLDEQIRLIFPHITPQVFDTLSPLLLMAIVQQSGSRLLANYLNILECETIVESEPRLRSMLLDGSKNGYKSVRLLKLLRPEHAPCATEIAWEGEYIGEGADLLWAHIQECFHGVPLDPNGLFYSKCSAIVQSSGTGKSRSVDQLSKVHFVIPVNLREFHSTGYPPTDGPAYNYLSGSVSQIDAFVRSCSFLHGLFVQTVAVLKTIKEPTAEKFWNHMKEGMKFGAHGPHRKKFYDAVKTLAQGFYPQHSAYFSAETRPFNDGLNQILLNDAFPLRKPFEELCKALESAPDHLPNKRRKPHPKSRASEHPLVVLAFDEVHTLTKPEDNGSWSRFGEMRRAIRGLRTLSLFTLFLSTSVTLFGTIPTPVPDVSARMLIESDDILPFCELGFDMFAKHLDFGKPVTLSHVTSEEHLTSYGRPLFPLEYWQGQQNTLFCFAAQKLLGGIAYNCQSLTDAQKLGCLAQRIPIEFLSATYASQVSDLEKEQVHSHMRVILKVDHRLETMVTTSPSEPVLSEAAYFVMTTHPHFIAAQVLQDILTGSLVNKGELGGLIVALLFTMARDKAVGPADCFGRPPNNQRWCSLTGLLTSLFCTPSTATDDHINVVTSQGWHFASGSPNQTKSFLADTFKDSKVYFTHFVKVHQQALIHVQYLMRLMARGAAVLCASGQPVDGIIPFLFKGDEIRLDNIGVIMFQVKDDVKCSNSPQLNLFHAMDPYSLGILQFPTNIPVIRIVFALAAKTPSLTFVDYNTPTTKTGRTSRARVKPTGITKESYTTYDFWVSGLSQEILVPIGKESNTWNSILQASSWERIYSDRLELRTRHRRSMNPGAAINSGFWESWCNLVSL